MPSKGSDLHSDVWGDESPCATTDHNDDLDREWRSRQEKFKNEGYREGFDAGKEDTVQEGFDDGQSSRQQQHFFHHPCFSCITHRSPFFVFPSISGYTKGTHAGYQWGFMQGSLSALECIRKTKPACLPTPSSSSTTEKLSTQLSSLPPKQTLETICATIHASSSYISSSVSITTDTIPPGSNSKNENLKGLIDQVKVDTMDFLQNTLDIDITRHTTAT
jgi:hypothetical protein